MGNKMFGTGSSVVATMAAVILTVIGVIGAYTFSDPITSNLFSDIAGAGFLGSIVFLFLIIKNLISG